MLDGTDIFILDVGGEIFVWVGRGATPNEKKSGMRFATQSVKHLRPPCSCGGGEGLFLTPGRACAIHLTRFLEQSGRPESTPISRVLQGGETAVFKAYFKQ
jgi:hypothetical protein